MTGASTVENCRFERFSLTGIDESLWYRPCLDPGRIRHCRRPETEIPMKLSLIIAATCGVIIAGPLGAQGVSTDSVPRGQRPPEGMCRVWVRGVPANQQPAPTDCANAVRNL